MVFIESTVFTRRLMRIARDAAEAVLHRIQNDLLRDPQRGDVVPGLGGVRKARVGNPERGKGKRGGYRYIYLYLRSRSHIHLLCLLDKNEQEDFTSEQRRDLRLLVTALRGKP